MPTTTTVTENMKLLAQAIYDGHGSWDAFSDACREAGMGERAIRFHTGSTACLHNPTECSLILWCLGMKTDH